jgi:hypothetical protein
MKSSPWSFGFVLFLLLLSACSFNPLSERRIEASGNPVAVVKEVQGFDQISLDGVGRLVISQGEKEALTIQTDEEFLPYFDVEVKGDTLSLGFSEAARGVNLGEPEDRGVDLVTYDLMVKELRGLKITGAVIVEVGALETDTLEIDLEGFSQIEIQSLVAEELILQLEGSGSLVISGKVREQQIFQEGACSYYAAELESEETSLVLSGAGDVTVWATETLEVELSGVGNVIYYGNPKVEQDISGLGRLIPMK